MTGGQKRQLFSGMVILTGARVAGSLCIFATTFLITRLFGAETMAHYSVYLAIASLLSVLLPCGFHAIASMLSAEYRAADKSEILSYFVRFARKLIFVTGIVAAVIAACIAFLAPNDGDYNLPLILLFALPSAIGMGLIYFNGGVLIGLQRPYIGQLPDMLLRPVLLVTAIAGLALFQETVPVWQLLCAATLIFAVTAGIQWRGVDRALPAPPAPKNEIQGEKQGWWKLAPSWTVITLLWDYFIELHILMASLLFAPFEVALLHICFRIRQLAGFGMKALYSLLMPKVFSANAQDEQDKTQSLIRLATRATMAYAVAAWLGVALIGSFMLGLFGEEYRQGYEILLIIMATLPIRALFGPAPAVLGMKRNHHRVAQILLVSLVVSIAMTMGGFQLGGLVAVAWAYLAATALTAVAMWVSARQKSGINCAVWA